MSCRRSLDVDPAAALRERQDPRRAAFHAHHPGCPECRTALAPWIRLDALVRAATRPPPGWHPPDAALLALLECPRSQTPEERAGVVRHLDACGPCRDALLAVAALPWPTTRAPGQSSPRGRLCPRALGPKALPPRAHRLERRAVAALGDLVEAVEGEEAAVLHWRHDAEVDAFP